MLCDLVGLIVILIWLLLYETYSELLLKNRIRFRYYSQYIPYGPLISENTSDECVAKSSSEFCVSRKISDIVVSVALNTSQFIIWYSVHVYFML